MDLGFGWTELAALGSLLGGIFTAAAFGAGLVVLVREIQTRRAETQERYQERRDEERRQARLVYATLDPDPPVPVGDITCFAGDVKYAEVWLRRFRPTPLVGEF